MKVVFIVIDFVLFAYFVLLYIENARFSIFGIDMGIWGIPLVSALILFINIIGLLGSYKSEVVTKCTLYLNGCLILL